MKQSLIEQCQIFELPQIRNRAGNITSLSEDIDFLFQFKRIFYIYDIPGGEDRGAHAHKQCHQLLVAASGSFEVELDDGKNKKTVYLNRPNFGLYIPPGIWAAEKRFSSGAVCLVLTSHLYDENDYIRDYEQFKDYNI